MPRPIPLPAPVIKAVCVVAKSLFLPVGGERNQKVPRDSARLRGVGVADDRG